MWDRLPRADPKPRQDRSSNVILQSLNQTSAVRIVCEALAGNSKVRRFSEFC